MCSIVADHGELSCNGAIARSVLLALLMMCILETGFFVLMLLLQMCNSFKTALAVRIGILF